MGREDPPRVKKPVCRAKLQGVLSQVQVPTYGVQLQATEVFLDFDLSSVFRFGRVHFQVKSTKSSWHH